MPKKNNLPEKKKSKNLGSEISESQISNSRISTFPEIQEELINPLEQPLMYTIDDLIDVWCRGCTNGATLWQYCQDNNKVLPTSFEAGLIELVNEVRHSDSKEQALQAVLNNNMILLGVFDEKI